MPDRREPLTPERLAQLLAQLDSVMTEAAQLRREISKQLDDQHRTLQPRVTPGRSRPPTRRKRAIKAR